MTFLKRITNLFTGGSKRSLGGFSAAAVSRLTNDWVTMSTTIDSILRMDLEKLRARMRSLSMSNPYVTNFNRMLKSNVIGAEGLQLKNKAKETDTVQNGKLVTGKPDVFANKVIEDQWWEWGKRGNCTVCGQLSWVDVQNLALSECSDAGEVLILKRFDYPNRWGFAIELIEADRLDIEHNDQLRNGNVVRMGRELNSQGQVVAYHIFKRSPNDYSLFGVSRRGEYERERIPAELIIHTFRRFRLDQNRGFPWLASTMLNLQMLGGYEEAELTRARVSASKMAFARRTGDIPYTGEKGRDGSLMSDVSPGAIEILPDGLEITPLDWSSPNSAFGEFMKSSLRSIAAGASVSYNNLANDYEGVNFSSGRMGQMEEREHYKCLQRWFAESFCEPIFSEWLLSALKTQAVPISPAKFAKFNQPHFTGRRWSWFDPVKEVNAKEKELQLNLTSLTRICQEQGIDRDELLDEIKEDREAMKARGLDVNTEKPQPAPPQAKPNQPPGKDEDDEEEGA